MLKKLLLPALVFIGAFSAAAQSDTGKQDFVLGVFIYVPFEKAIINTDISRELRRAGLPPCDYASICPGIGFRMQVRRGIIQLSYNQIKRRPKSDDYALTVEYRAFSFGAGYDVLQHPYFSLYPYVGFKGCGTDYDYVQKAQGSPTLGTYLATPQFSKNLTNSRAHLDLGVGFSHQIFYLINVQAGVLLPLEKSRWYTNDSKLELKDAPAIRYGGYVTLSLGIGNIESGKLERENTAERNLFRTSMR